MKPLIREEGVFIECIVAREAESCGQLLGAWQIWKEFFPTIITHN